VSYQFKPRYGWIVACDLCDSFGALFDRDWREMRKSEQGDPIHLCRACRKTALWCQEHRRYHRPADNHRCACRRCGGLFTARVSQQIEYCPSCGRLAPAAAAARA
jgi:hypothetical protein